MNKQIDDTWKIISVDSGCHPHLPSKMIIFCKMLNLLKAFLDEILKKRSMEKKWHPERGRIQTRCYLTEGKCTWHHSWGIMEHLIEKGFGFDFQGFAYPPILWGSVKA